MIANDDMVQQFNADDRASFHEPLRDIDVFGRRRGISGWMIVRANNRCGRASDGFAEDFAGVDDGGVEAADKNGLPVHHLVFDVEEQTDEMFLLE